MPRKIKDLYNVRYRPDKDIGIEIEMEGQHLPIGIPKFWQAAHDGSLRGESIEYILRAPIHRSKTSSRLLYLKKYLKDNGAILAPSDRCGVHIHVNCQELTENQVLNFAILYLIFEAILVKWCGEDREGNLFCLRASDAEYIIQGLIQCRQNSSLRHMQNNRFRYASINMAAIKKFGSVEFRAMGTPKNLSSIQLWIEMLLKIKKASLGYREPHEIVEDLSLIGGIEYVKRVFGPLYKHLICPDLHQLCIEGVQRVQPIAYTLVEEPENPNLIFGDAQVRMAPRADWVPDFPPQADDVEEEPQF